VYTANGSHNSQHTEEIMINFARLSLLVLVLFSLGAFVVAGSSPQSTRSQTGKLLQVTGQVTVNGARAVAGATISSDTEVTTAQNSSAVVSLGKLGRVEVLPQTTMKLSFADDTVSVSMLDAGRVRISSSSNVNASATTNDGHIIATDRQRNEFIVDTSCGNTFVSVKKGRVELRLATDANTVKQIAAGSQDSAGTARPGCTPAP
jgi:ribosomal 50S subunit-recycling heat shock protein